MARVKHNALNQYTAGLNNAPTSHPAAALPFTHPVFQGWKVYYESITDSAVRVDDAYWEITAIGSGTIVAGDENSLVIANSTTTDNEGYIIQRDFADIELTSDTKKFYLETRVKIVAAAMAQQEWFVGWAADAQATASDGATWDADEIIGFGHLDADTSVFFVSREDDVNQLISVGSDSVTTEYRKYSCYYDGAVFNVYVNDVKVASQTMTQLNADEPMVFQFMGKSGESAAQEWDCQYALLAVEL